MIRAKAGEKILATYPAGTITFLFTDIEGSTKLWEQYLETMKSALAKHDAILRHSVESSGGTLIVVYAEWMRTIATFFFILAWNAIFIALGEEVFLRGLIGGCLTGRYGVNR